MRNRDNHFCGTFHDSPFGLGIHMAESTSPNGSALPLIAQMPTQAHIIASKQSSYAFASKPRDIESIMGNAATTPFIILSKATEI
jgi:hypothetical protein